IHSLACHAVSRTPRRMATTPSRLAQSGVSLAITMLIPQASVKGFCSAPARPGQAFEPLLAVSLAYERRQTQCGRVLPTTRSVCKCDRSSEKLQRKDLRSSSRSRLLSGRADAHRPRFVWHTYCSHVARNFSED